VLLEPQKRGLDPLYFDRRRSIEGALQWGGEIELPRNAVDIGANVGQTLQTFIGWWPKLHCLSLEPLPAAFIELQKVAWGLGENVEVLNLGASDKTDKLTLHGSISQTTKSSFRKFNKSAETAQSHRGLRDKPSHFELGDEDSYETEVKVETLDNLFDVNSNLSAAKKYSEFGLDLLKIDTQGWELSVLRGAHEVLKNTKVVLTEWQFDEVYGKPPSIYELDKILTESGLRLWDISHIYKDLKTMRTLWVDLVYARPGP